MSMRDLIKAFMAGLVFPAVFFPFLYTFMYFTYTTNLQLYPLQFMALYLPIVFGLSNVVYVTLSREARSISKNALLWIIGLLLGLAIAGIGVFYLHLPQNIFNMDGYYQYMPLIALPIIYGIVFRFIIKWLNNIVHID